MSIVGVTIDYGPFGFMDTHDPGHICNKSDDGGRYAYDQQPSVCRWNLKKLSEALAPYLSSADVDGVLKMYDEEFEKCFQNKIRTKLGLIHVKLEEDIKLIEGFLDTLHKTACDFTNGFRGLNNLCIPGCCGDESDVDVTLTYLVSQCCSPEECVTLLTPSSSFSLGSFGMMFLSQKQMGKMIKAKKLKETTVKELEEDNKAMWKEWLLIYRKRLAQEIADTSSQEDIIKMNKERLRIMNANNPRFILRNHIAQGAIELAEEGDYSEVDRVLCLLKNPYTDEVNPAEVSVIDHSQQATANRQQSASSNDKKGSFYCSKPSLQALGLSVT